MTLLLLALSQSAFAWRDAVAPPTVVYRFDAVRDEQGRPLLPTVANGHGETGGLTIYRWEDEAWAALGHLDDPSMDVALALDARGRPLVATSATPALGPCALSPPPVSGRPCPRKLVMGEGER